MTIIGLGFCITVILFILYITETIAISPFIICLPLIIALLIDIVLIVLLILIKIINAFLEAKAKALDEENERLKAECAKYGQFVKINQNVFKNIKK